MTLLDVTEGIGAAVLFGRHVAKEEEGVFDDTTGRYVKQRVFVLCRSRTRGGREY